MKKILYGFFCCLVLATSTGSYAQDIDPYINDPEYVRAVTWMYEMQFTKYVDPVLFHPEALLTREQAAKFFVGYATKIALLTIDTSRYCAFDDLDEADPTLKNDILQGCLLHLFKGTQGKFLPTAAMTKEQVLTVLLRIIEPTPIDETGTPRWSAVYERAYARGLTKESDVFSLDRPLTRYELALLFFRMQPQQEQ